MPLSILASLKIKKGLAVRTCLASNDIEKEIRDFIPEKLSELIKIRKHNTDGFVLHRFPNDGEQIWIVSHDNSSEIAAYFESELEVRKSVLVFDPKWIVGAELGGDTHETLLKEFFPEDTIFRPFIGFNESAVRNGRISNLLEPKDLLDEYPCLIVLDLLVFQNFEVSMILLSNLRKEIGLQQVPIMVVTNLEIEETGFYHRIIYGLSTFGISPNQMFSWRALQEVRRLKNISRQIFIDERRSC